MSDFFVGDKKYIEICGDNFEFEMKFALKVKGNVKQRFEISTPLRERGHTLPANQLHENKVGNVSEKRA